MEPQPFDTLSVHAGRFITPQNPASSPPLYQASSYEFADLAEVEAVYEGSKPGGIYGRYGGPNGTHFEAAMAELEAAEAAVGAASGMAAIAAALWTNLRPGDRLVAGVDLYGGTQALLESDFQEAGVEVVFVDQTDLGAVEKAVAAGPAKLLLAEALTNPLVRLADVPELAAIARRHGALLMVDATFATPALLRPARHGADLVVHSVGKYLGGHADIGIGVLAGRKDLIERARAFIVRNGSFMGHFEAWLSLRSLRTLALRMERHSANGAAVAAYLAGAGVPVHHPSLPSHPQHALAMRLFPRGTGGMLAFDLEGGRAAVEAFLGALRRITIVHSLGEVATTISYSAVSSHRFLAPELRRARGVGDGTLRLSVGIEDPADIIADLEAALGASRSRLAAGATPG